MSDDPIEAGLTRLNVTLSPLLRYVLTKVCLGMTDDEIAEALEVSKRTASGYVSRLFAATKTSSRAALVAQVLGGIKQIHRSEKIAAAAWKADCVTMRRAKP